MLIIGQARRWWRASAASGRPGWAGSTHAVEQCLGGFVKLLGDQAQGVIVSQVMPRQPELGLVAEATQLAKAQGADELSPAMLEGFARRQGAGSKACAAGLNPAVPACTRPWTTWAASIWAARCWTPAPATTRGWIFPDLSIIGTGGRFRR